MSVLVNRSHRVPFEQPIWMGDPDGFRPLRRLWATNLSEGGMFVRCAEPLLPGERVLVALEGHEAILPMAEAVVVWQRRSDEEAPAGVGLQFTELRPFGDQVVSSVVRTAKPSPLASSEHPEPTTPLLEIQARPPTPEPAAPTRKARPAADAYSTELHLLGQPTVAVRAAADEVRLDFAPRRVASVVQEGSRVTVSFRD